MQYGKDFTIEQLGMRRGNTEPKRELSTNAKIAEMVGALEELKDLLFSLSPRLKAIRLSRDAIELSLDANK